MGASWQHNPQGQGKGGCLRAGVLAACEVAKTSCGCAACCTTASCECAACCTTASWLPACRMRTIRQWHSVSCRWDSGCLCSGEGFKAAAHADGLPIAGSIKQHCIGALWNGDVHKGWSLHKGWIS